MKTKFWTEIPHSAKYSEINEYKHKRLLADVLYDPNTFISVYDRNSYILYDNNGIEALLFRPKSLITRIGAKLYYAVVRLFPGEYTNGN